MQPALTLYLGQRDNDISYSQHIILGGSQLIEDIRRSLQGSRNSFESNVQDVFGRAFCEAVYEPLASELAGLQEDMGKAQQEQAVIRDMLAALRVML